MGTINLSNILKISLDLWFVVISVSYSLETFIHEPLSDLTTADMNQRLKYKSNPSGDQVEYLWVMTNV